MAYEEIVTRHTLTKLQTQVYFVNNITEMVSIVIIETKYLTRDLNLPLV
jgi:hypothetical protein